MPTVCQPCADRVQAQFSLWAVMAAPLMLGVSVANMSPYDIQTYTNKARKHPYRAVPTQRHAVVYFLFI